MAQARDAGLDRRARHHHLSYGNWRRTEAPGVLRLVGWPEDALERHAAWLLCVGGDAALTSWTALELRRLTVVGPRHPVEVAVAPAATRTEVRRRLALERQLASLASSGATSGVGGPSVRASAVADRSPARLHRLPPGATPAEMLHGLPVRPASEAMCAAISSARTSTGAAISLALADELVRFGRLDPSELLQVALWTGCTRLRDHLFLRLADRRAERGIDGGDAAA